MKALVTIPNVHVRDTFITPKALQELKKYADVVFNPHERQFSPQELVEYAKDTDILITGWGTPLLNKDILENTSQVKIIAHTGGSVGSLVDEYAYSKGIKVLSGNDVYAKSVAEGCLCYTLWALRQNDKYVNIVRNGGWREDEFTNKGLRGKKVGLVGYGAIAKYFVELLRWFNTKIYVYSSHLTQEQAESQGVEKATNEFIFENCDVISIHSALTPKTEGMINANLLSKIKQGALLVNTARGGIIDEPVLIQMLSAGRFYAVLDVFNNEPLESDSPLRTLPNVLPLPHMGGPTIDMREEVVLSLADDIGRFLRGEPMNNEIPYEHSVRMTR